MSKETKPGVFVVSFDFPTFLQKLTDTEGWKEVNGPSSGVGLDYWYENAEGSEAYINLDQGEMTVSIDDDVVWQGSSEEAEVL